MINPAFPNPKTARAPIGTAAASKRAREIFFSENPV
jgi:hypothetical protein